MSANLILDLGNTTQFGVSIVGDPVLSGALVHPCSGAVIGNIVDMLHSDTYCNLVVTGFSASGQLRVVVQNSDTATSGALSTGDPTSGIAAFPGAFVSGTILWINSGGTGGGVLGAFVSGQAIASGFGAAQAFQRTGRYVRALLLSGDFGAGPLTVAFLSQFKTTGSGGGFTWSPGSGTTINV